MNRNYYIGTTVDGIYKGPGLGYGGTSNVLDPRLVPNTDRTQDHVPHTGSDWSWGTSRVWPARLGTPIVWMPLGLANVTGGCHTGLVQLGLTIINRLPIHRYQYLSISGEGCLYYGHPCHCHGAVPQGPWQHCVRD